MKKYILFIFLVTNFGCYGVEKTHEKYLYSFIDQIDQAKVVEKKLIFHFIAL